MSETVLSDTNPSSVTATSLSLNVTKPSGSGIQIGKWLPTLMIKYVGITRLLPPFDQGKQNAQNSAVNNSREGQEGNDKQYETDGPSTSKKTKSI